MAALAVVVLVHAASAQAPRQFYASPAGSPANDGSITRPLDLDTALSSLGPVRAGDTVWLRGGVYRRQPGPAYNGATALYVSTLTGTAAAPIVVRQYPGERATLDGNLGPSLPVLVVDGSYAWYWGFEITNSGLNRSSTRGAGIDSYGHHNRFINLVIHDTGQGVGFWATSQADDAEVYGSIISHVGWEGADRGHGHSLYVQNVNGTKRIIDNVMFDGFSFGVHAYTENGRIDNIAVAGNILFNHGILSLTGGLKANVLFAGGQVAQSPTVSGNFAYYPTGSAGRNVDISECNNGRVQSNYLAGGTPLRLTCSNTVVTGNTTYGPVAAATQSAYPANVYGTTPTGVFVGLRPNAYEPGRANIAIFNWSRHSSVAVDVAAALAVGMSYEVRDAQNFFGPPVASGVYGGGSIAIPMSGLTAAAPIGNVPLIPPHTAPEFGAFVLLPTGTPAGPPPPPPVPPPPSPSLRLDAVSPTSGGAGGGFNVNLAGAGFDSSTAVAFGGVSATGVVVHSATALTVTAPSHLPGAVDVVVTRGAQQVTGAGGFTYAPTPPLLRPIAVTGNQLALQWSGGSQTPARAFYLIGGLTPGGSEFGPYPMGLATNTAAVVGPGRYYARIVADTAWGLLTSNEGVAVVGGPAPPAAPSLAAAVVSGRAVGLSWSASPGASAYVVVARLAPTGPVVVALPVGGTSFEVAAPPGVFHVSVVAVNGIGLSAESNQIVVPVS